MGADKEAREIGRGHTGGLECQAGKHEFSAESHRELMKACQRADSWVARCQGSGARALEVLKTPRKSVVQGGEGGCGVRGKHKERALSCKHWAHSPGFPFVFQALLCRHPSFEWPFSAGASHSLILGCPLSTFSLADSGHSHGHGIRCHICADNSQICSLLPLLSLPSSQSV